MRSPLTNSFTRFHSPLLGRNFLKGVALAFLLLLLFLFLATPQVLWDFSSPTSDRTWALGSESMES